MAAMIFTSANPNEFAAFLVEAGGEVRVRFRRSGSRPQWRCDACGVHRFATCGHEVRARDEWRRLVRERENLP